MRRGNHRWLLGKRDSGGSPGISSRSSRSIARVVRQASQAKRSSTRNNSPRPIRITRPNVPSANPRARQIAITIVRITRYWNANSRARKRTIQRPTRSTRMGGAPSRTSAPILRRKARAAGTAQGYVKRYCHPRMRGLIARWGIGVGLAIALAGPAPHTRTQLPTALGSPLRRVRPRSRPASHRRTQASSGSTNRQFAALSAAPQPWSRSLARAAGSSGSRYRNRRSWSRRSPRSIQRSRLTPAAASTMRPHRSASA